MEKLLQIILNECIPKNKINKFSELVGEYGFNNLTYYNEEKQLKMDYYKIPIDILKQRLYNKISEVEGSPIYYLTLYFLMIIAEIPACDAATLIQRK